MRSYFAPLALAALCSPVTLAQAETAPAGAVSAAQAPSPTLSLSEAVSLALAHNPALKAARLELQAMEAAQLQAGARPNPALGVLVEDTRSATRSTTLQWSQPIELGGKRAARLSAAARAHEQAHVAWLAKQAELRAAVTSGYFDLLGAQEQVRLTQACLDLAHNASAMAARRVQAGKVPPLEQTKAQVAEAGVRIELAQAQSELRLSRQRLASFWGQSRLGFVHAEGDAGLLPTLPSDERVGLWMAQAPTVRLARLEIARQQALSDGERARRVPDLTVTLGAKRAAELGRTQALIGLSMPLPLLDTNQGNLQLALSREAQAREALTSTTLQLQGEVSQALERLRLKSEQVQMLRAEVLPAAQFAYDAVVKGYALGKFAFLDVLDAQRTLFQLRQQVLRSAAEAYHAAADLDRLLGLDAQLTDAPQE